MTAEHNHTILLIEDEPDILDVVRYNLEQAGYGILAAGDGEEGLALAMSEIPDLVVLDLMLPGLDGMDVCKALRGGEQTRDIPVLMLTARRDEVDRVRGLELGADDYVVKPFSPRELVLRVRAILRRSSDATADERIRIGPLNIDLSEYRAWLDDEPLLLTATEFKLLTTLIDRQGRVQSREALLNAVWGYDYAGYGRTVDTHIRRLREKLGQHDQMIETVRGVGYRFSPKEP
ncbi:MAG TPA: DNA-binding response regulator [Candidatus Latescibacteria bacterium]|nr:DNA-binding response regulator [Candidatus Latescibacterota bacterium]